MGEADHQESTDKMPIISYFFGIIIRLYFHDHDPPHFHAEYQGTEGRFAIPNGKYLEGTLPTKAIRLISEWADRHQSELMRIWELAQADQPLERVPGADYDEIDTR